MRDWLIEQGWSELFLDLDPERGLKAGQRWQEALKQAAERCEVVIFLISPAWAESKWCLAEFLLAKQIGKPIFGVIVEPTPFADIPIEMTAEWQLIDLTAGARDQQKSVTLPRDAGTATVAFAADGLSRLRIALMQSGLDPKYFKWPPDHDPQRAPYRGLKPLDTDDTGIFFGRDGPTVVGLDTLRALREAAPPRLLVILGASGAGKSSFMRAGLLPRLAREDQHFLPLPVVRPEHAVMTGESGLIVSLEQALQAAKVIRTRADIRTEVEAGATGVRRLLSALAEAKQRQFSDGIGKAPTIILPIDQAEELFAVDGAKEAEPFLQLINGLVAEDGPAVLVLFTIRSDNYEPLQTAPALNGHRQHTLSLAPMPHGAYANVIAGPAERLYGTPRALVVEEPLVQALLDDIEQGGAKDALPLLAFTLERLYLEFRSAGRLTVEQYKHLGGITGSIEAAVKQAFTAADKDSRIPRDPDARLILLRRGLIPWLAGIDPDTKAPRRRVARLSEIPAEARPLINLLVEQRLLSTDVAKDTGEITIEPAHEALLRQWGLLQGWLKEDTGLLIVLDGVRRASRDWAANDRNALWIVHAGERLQAATSLGSRQDILAHLESTDLAYLHECNSTESRVKRRSVRIKAIIAILGGCLFAGINAWLNREKVEDFAFWVSQVRPYILTASTERKLAPLATFRECNACPEMVVIQSGTFSMGSNDRPEHGPIRNVVFSKQFSVSRYEITFQQ